MLRALREGCDSEPPPSDDGYALWRSAGASKEASARSRNRTVSRSPDLASSTITRPNCMRASHVSCADSRSPDEHREVHAASKAAPTASAISGSKGCNGGAGTVSSIAALRPTQLNFVCCGQSDDSAALPATRRSLTRSIRDRNKAAGKRLLQTVGSLYAAGDHNPNGLFGPSTGLAGYPARSPKCQPASLERSAFASKRDRKIAASSGSSKQ